MIIPACLNFLLRSFVMLYSCRDVLQAPPRLGALVLFALLLVILFVSTALLSSMDSSGVPITKKATCLYNLGFRCLPRLLLRVLEGNRNEML